MAVDLELNESRRCAKIPGTSFVSNRKLRTGNMEADINSQNNGNYYGTAGPGCEPNIVPATNRSCGF